MEQQNISQAEWQVMRVLWAYPHSRSTEIIARLEADFAWKPATIKTLLNRLKTKEFIAMEKLRVNFTTMLGFWKRIIWKVHGRRF